MRSFSLVEILVIIGIMVLLMVFSIPAYHLFQRGSDLTNSSFEIGNTLRLAQSKTLASEGASQYGVYFNQNTVPHQYTLFKGSSYGSRDSTFDEVHELSNFLEIFEINLAGGEPEVVFKRISGTTNQPGNISLRLQSDPQKTKSIYIESSGQIDFLSPATSSDEERIKDSRHVHFTYNQNAKNATTLHLIFSDYPADNFDIDFQSNLNSDKTKFSWEGSILAGPAGSKTEQRLLIQTHSLELTSAQFSIHRDQRHNDKALEIWLDDQNLLNYTADGQTQEGSSIYVTDPQWQ